MHFIQLHLANDPSLYSIYMPHIEQGGIFVTQTALPESLGFYSLGLEIHLLLTIQASGLRWPLVGRVAWVSHTDLGHGVGIGIQLHEGQQKLLEYIDEIKATSD